MKWSTETIPFGQNARRPLISNLRAYGRCKPIWWLTTGKNWTSWNEIGQFLEWRFYDQIEWSVLNNEFNPGSTHYIKENLEPSLQRYSFAWSRWCKIRVWRFLTRIIAKVSPFFRTGDKPRDFLIVVCNFTPVERRKFQVGVPYEGHYEVLLNTEMQGIRRYLDKSSGDDHQPGRYEPSAFLDRILHYPLGVFVHQTKTRFWC